MKLNDTNQMPSHRSIRAEFAAIFIGLMAGTIILYWIINSLFLEKYYIREKRISIVRAYDAIDLLSLKAEPGSEEFEKAFFQICSSANLNVAVVTPSLETVISTDGDNMVIVGRLLDHIFDIDDNWIEKSLVSENRAVNPETFPRKNEGAAAGKKSGETQILTENDFYEVRISRDPRMRMDYLELWGTLTNSNIIIMRTPLDSIREGASVSNRFLALAGLLMMLACGIIIWFVTGKITEPILELADLSERMTRLDFNARYTRDGSNEIAVLGSHMNELSSTLERNISELKTANNELLRDIEKKERQDSMRQEFLASAAHELKTPIALVQGYAEGLRDNISDDPESREFYCDVIIDEAEKMNRLVKNLMTLNQLEYGEEEIQLERFDVTELIRGCIQANDLQLKQNGISVSFHQKDPVYVWSDEFKTETVFTNYFSNAVHYCSFPKGGGEEKEKRIEVKCVPSGRSVRISVFNTGEPVPEDSLDRLWDKFYKVDKARTRAYGGSGIGLSIVKAIMNSLNQDFGVKNYGNGVEFWFELDAGVPGKNAPVRPEG